MNLTGHRDEPLTGLAGDFDGHTFEIDAQHLPLSLLIGGQRFLVTRTAQGEVRVARIAT